MICLALNLLTVVAGPATTSEEWYFFCTLVGKKKVKNLVLLRSAGNYEEVIANSDVCVSVASYNSAVMIMKHRKKAVLIPFEGSGTMSCIEQPARARMLNEMMGTQVLPIDKLTAKVLVNKIKNASRSRCMPAAVPKKWFVGEELLDNSMTDLLNPLLKRGQEK